MVIIYRLYGKWADLDGVGIFVNLYRLINNGGTALMTLIQLTTNFQISNVTSVTGPTGVAPNQTFQII